MPTIKLNKERVINLIGKKIPDKDLVEKIPYLGTDLESVTKEEIIVEIFPNRPDLLSEEGFARALGSFLNIKPGLRKYESKKSNYEIKITKEVKQVRPHTACAVIKGLKLDDKKIEDIINIQEKLHITYGRNRKRCAIGVYPMEAIAWPITYTAEAPDKIKFVPLEETKPMTGKQILEKHPKGKEYAYLLEGKTKYPVFVDAKGDILSMPPIINSEKTGKISTKTSDIFLECSGFDFDVVSKAVTIISAALADMGGEIFEVKIKREDLNHIKTPELNPEPRTLDPEYARKYLGFEITDAQIILALRKMGMDAVKTGKLITIQVPAYRTDILHQIDFVEDIAIGHGYDNVREDHSRTYSTAAESYSEKVKRKIREILVGTGLLEINTFSLVPSEDQTRLGYSDAIKIQNSVSSEFDSLRQSLIYGSLKTLQINKKHEYPQTFFDMGTVFRKNKNKDTGTEEYDLLAVTLCSESANFTAIKQHLDLVMNALNIKYALKATNFKNFIPGRLAKIQINNQECGYLGEIHPEILDEYDLKMPVAYFEIALSPIISTIIK